MKECSAALPEQAPDTPLAGTLALIRSVLNSPRGILRQQQAILRTRDILHESMHATTVQAGVVAATPPCGHACKRTMATGAEEGARGTWGPKHRDTPEDAAEKKRLSCKLVQVVSYLILNSLHTFHHLTASSAPHNHLQVTSRKAALALRCGREVFQGQGVWNPILRY